VSCLCWAPSLMRARVCLLSVTVSNNCLTTYVSLDVLRRTQYRTPVGSLQNAVLRCALFTKPYHSNYGAVLLRLCVAMGMLLNSNEHLQVSTVADRLSMFATCGRIPWEAPTTLIILRFCANARWNIYLVYSNHSERAIEYHSRHECLSIFILLYIYLFCV
jgi:hypothetical protein